MPKVIDRAELRRLVTVEHAQVVEVLPADEFESEHIAGAQSLPLKDLSEESVQALDRNRPVIVYCNDFQ